MKFLQVDICKTHSHSCAYITCEDEESIACPDIRNTFANKYYDCNKYTRTEIAYVKLVSLANNTNDCVSWLRGKYRNHRKYNRTSILSKSYLHFAHTRNRNHHIQGLCKVHSYRCAHVDEDIKMFTNCGKKNTFHDFIWFRDFWWKIKKLWISVGHRHAREQRNLFESCDGSHFPSICKAEKKMLKDWLESINCRWCWLIVLINCSVGLSV